MSPSTKTEFRAYQTAKYVTIKVPDIEHLYHGQELAIPC